MKTFSNTPLVKLVYAYAAVAVVVLGYIIIGRPSNTVIVGLTFLVVLIPLLTARTDYAILALVILRPVVDTFSTYTMLSFGSLSLNMNAVLALAVCAWGLFTILRERIQLRAIPNFYWLLGFLLVSFFSFAVSLSLSVSIGEWLRIASIMMFYIVGYHLAKQDNHFVVKVINAIAISAVIPIAMGFFQLFNATGLSADGINNRIFGTFGHPNVLGFYMVLVLGVIVMRYITTPFYVTAEHKRSLVYPWIIAGASLALLFTYTRGAWLGLVIYAIVVCALQFRRPLVYGLIVLGVVVVSGQLINQVLVQTSSVSLEQIPIIQRMTMRNEEADSINWRFLVLQQMAPKTLSQPILGYGIGNFVTLRNQGDIGLYDSPEAHDDYLRLAIEVGFVGLFMYVMMIANWIRLAFVQYLIWPQGSWQKYYSLALLALLFSFYGMSFGDNILQGTAVLWSFFLVIGSILALRPRTPTGNV